MPGGPSTAPRHADQGNSLPAIRVSRANNIVIDGFMILHGTGAGVQVRSGSMDVLIRNCQVLDTTGDGILVQDSSNITIFNTLVYSSSPAASSFPEPTIHFTNNTGVRTAAPDRRCAPSITESSDTFARNNIIQDNRGDNVEVSSGLDTYDGGLSPSSPIPTCPTPPAAAPTSPAMRCSSTLPMELPPFGRDRRRGGHQSCH